MGNKLTFKDKVFIVISFFYIIYTIFPLFADITGIPVFIPAIALAISILLMFPKAFWGETTVWFLVYVVFLLLYTLFDKQIYINGLNQSLPPIYRITIESAWILPAISIMNVLLYKNDTRLFKIVGYGSIVLLLVSFLYILPLVSSTANILRDNMYEVESFRPKGLPDYTLMHAYTMMILPLCLLVKETGGKQKYLYLSVLLLFAYMITQTAVTTSLIVMLVAVLFTYCFNIKKMSRSVLIIGFLLFIAYVLSLFDIHLRLIEFLMPYFEGTAVAFKLEDIHASLIQGEVTGGSLTVRANYHQISTDAFLDNPFIGSGISHVGHSKILDTLGAMGLFVFIPYFMILYSSLKRYTSRIMDIQAKMYLCFSFFVAGIYLYTKGLFGNPGYLFMLVIVPSILMSVYSSKKTK